ncbi:MAG: xanthine dehydrogenase family protein molybdopterin-binding subunit [Proteobacteria bacterium]|nr:xanthine dehydrogenase family protein molybdopterin-binding subunit [Burkholderiales bacterium]
MKFDKPATANAIDRGLVIGRSIDRIDGPAKVTGTARYAYERNEVARNVAYGWIVGAAIATGRIVQIDTKAAAAAPGVVAIVTYMNAGKLGQAKPHASRMLAGPEVQHYDQAVALVVADTFEQARDAAKLVRVDYAPRKGRFDLAAEKGNAIKKDGEFGVADTASGDFAGAFSRAAVKLDETYTTPDHSHAMMEPHATIAAWSGDKLMLWTSNQMIAWAVRDTAETLLIPASSIQVSSPFIGGGFGAKLWIRSDAILAALGARAARRPVKVALSRPLIANNTVHRPATIQRVRIGARSDGRIDAIAHESWSGDLPGGKTEDATFVTRLLYAGEHRMTAQRLAVLDLPEGNAMRAPGEAPGSMALEVAMDELAEKLDIDPVRLRIINDVQYDPEKGLSRPFTSRKLVECLTVGAQRFGWDKRNRKPAQVRDGRWLVGMGMAAALRGNPVMDSAARVGVDAKGVVTVETDMTDIGTGSYTIIAQTAAETMGVPLAQVRVKLGDSTFPVSAGSGGQWGANSSTAGVYAACMTLRQTLAKKTGFDADEARFESGRIRVGNRSVTLAQAAGPDGVVVEDKVEFGDLQKRFAHASFGAHFVEVGVDAMTGETRVRRMAGVFAAGRILNPKSARNQVIGGMTMGVGAALMEELVVDKRHGYFVNHDLAEYQIPVHADIPSQDVMFLDELDDKSSPMKAKGVGELGICGAGAAVANAIYNATGIRVRDYPITLDKLLPGLRSLA